jgi:hypothetical protein
VQEQIGDAERVGPGSLVRVPSLSLTRGVVTTAARQVSQVAVKVWGTAPLSLASVRKASDGRPPTEFD